MKNNRLRLIIDKFSAKSENSKLLKWIKRLGIWGFLFFLIKGLIWLCIPLLIAWGLL